MSKTSSSNMMSRPTKQRLECKSKSADICSLFAEFAFSQDLSDAYKQFQVTSADQMYTAIISEEQLRGKFASLTVDSELAIWLRRRVSVFSEASAASE